MAYRQVRIPSDGQKITIAEQRLQVPDNPILGYVEGDGIGPDITRACLRIWDAAVAKAYDNQRKIHWCELYLGEKAAQLYDGDYFPAETLEAIKELVVAIKGPLTTPVGGGFRSLNVALRQELDLYACVRPVRYYQGVPSPMRHPEQFDIVIFRENTEDVYAGLEYASGSDANHKLAAFLRQELKAEFFEDAGLGIKPISAFASKRLVRKAIQYALDHGRESVTLVHKGNIMKYTEGAFRAWGYEVAREEFAEQTITEDEVYQLHGGKVPPGKIVIKDRIADIMFQLLLLRPQEFDVLATPNLNGDYLSDAAAAQVGGIGIAPVPTSATSWRCSRRPTAPRPSMPGRTRSTRVRCCSAGSTCWNTSAGRRRPIWPDSPSRPWWRTRSSPMTSRARWKVRPKSVPAASPMPSSSASGMASIWRHSVQLIVSNWRPSGASASSGACRRLRRKCWPAAASRPPSPTS